MRMNIYVIFVAILLVIAVNCKANIVSNDVCSFSNPLGRIEGGWPGISRPQCEALHKCYDESIDDAIKCFRPSKGRSESPRCDFSNPTKRLDGGWGGINKIQCESQGNCFDDTIYEVKWCFKLQDKISSYNCNFKENPRKRVDAGLAGLSKKECVANNYCFDDSFPNAVSCFKYNSGRTVDSKCDYANPENRVRGGVPGISKDECESDDNCFDDTIPGFIFCFVPRIYYIRLFERFYNDGSNTLR